MRKKRTTKPVINYVYAVEPMPEETLPLMIHAYGSSQSELEQRMRTGESENWTTRYANLRYLTADTICQEFGLTLNDLAELRKGLDVWTEIDSAFVGYQMPVAPEGR